MRVKRTKLISFVDCKFRFLAHSPVFLAVLLCLSSASLASADAIYSFSLPANGSVSALNIQLTFPSLLAPGGLGVIPLTAPLVTSLTFTTPGFTPATSVIGFQVTPTATLVGVALSNSANQLLLLTPGFPGDFFTFPRLPLDTGTLLSTSGNVTSVLPLTTGSPVGTLTVTSTTVPEPSAVLLVLSGLAVAGVGALRRRE